MTTLAVRDRRSVLRRRPFQRLWSGASIFALGDQVSLLALPLVGVLTLDACTARLGRGPGVTGSLFAVVFLLSSPLPAVKRVPEPARA